MDQETTCIICLQPGANVRLPCRNEHSARWHGACSDEFFTSKVLERVGNATPAQPETPLELSVPVACPICRGFIATTFVWRGYVRASLLSRTTTGVVGKALAGTLWHTCVHAVSFFSTLSTTVTLAQRYKDGELALAAFIVVAIAALAVDGFFLALALLFLRDFRVALWCTTAASLAISGALLASRCSLALAVLLPTLISGSVRMLLVVVMLWLFCARDMSFDIAVHGRAGEDEEGGRLAFSTERIAPLPNHHRSTRESRPLLLGSPER